MAQQSEDFDSMNKAELRKAAKELGVRQKNVAVAELKAACKRAVQEPQQPAQRDIDAMYRPELKAASKRPEGHSKLKAELRKAAKELGVHQKDRNGAELKAACKRAVQEQQQQTSLTAWLAPYSGPRGASDA